MKKIKPIAMYLPQFHRTVENDEWWGEGFTDWVSVKGATSLIENHNQPREPLNDNYYDLLDKKTMEWQADLAKKYSVYGFCFYHYWFKEGRKILEKPAENLLRWTDVDMKFCFSWANVTWAQTWSKITSINSWAPQYEKNELRKKYEDGILLEQKYGREDDWIEHFNYLLPFFEDSRYIKIDGKPLFVIYRTMDMPVVQQMMRLWNKLARENGFPGIYVIGEFCNEYSSQIDACMRHEPEVSRGIIRTHNLVKGKSTFTLEYDDVYEAALSEKRESPFEKKYLMCFTDFDNTPRKGKNGNILTGVTVEKFEKYFSEAVKKSREWGNEYIFINAWNEWGEGMYLEPDKTRNYGFLEAVNRVVDADAKQNRQTTAVIKPNTYMANMKCLDKWLYINEEGKKVTDFLADLKCSQVAIYGCGILGKHLLLELENSEIVVKYMIDKNKSGKMGNINIVGVEGPFEEVDAIIITPAWDFNSIEEELSQKFTGKILSLSEILYELY